jgi:hypothetical protein|tara:strand:+ start:175 stop:396 length:222 start_codon:yes stop_codon:yes gene_type:complete
MEHLDVSVIQILKDAKMDNWKEWLATIIILPIFIIGFIVLYTMMITISLTAMIIDWWIAIPYQRRNGKNERKN